MHHVRECDRLTKVYITADQQITRMDLLTLTLVLLAIYLVYSWLIRKHEYWGRLGVRFLKPTFLFGNMFSVVFKKVSLTEHFENIYKELKSNKYGGWYEFFTPMFMPTDPDLIKDITVKYFDHFPNRRSVTNSQSDPLLDRALINLKGEEWREMRNRLSPAFTTSKLRGMFPLITRCGEQFARFLVTRTDAKTAPIEFKSAFTRLTNDVVATVAFGVECNAINNPEEKFYKLGRRIMDFTGIRMIIVFGFMIAPKLMKWLGMSLMPKDASDYFQQTIQGTLDHREKNGVVRPDMLQLLMEAQKGGIKQIHGDEQDAGTVGESEDASAIHSKHLSTKVNNNNLISNKDISSQAFLFFLAGFDTVSTMLSFLSHELAVNPDIQETLRDEIDSAILDNEGKLTYESIQSMKYLDMVISESLRKYPPAAFTDRICTKNFTLPGTDVVIEKGVVVMIPIYPLQRDPEYFSNPDKFDPERFNDENKKNIKPYTYLPFGSGPHNCIGMRFALLEVKVATAYMLATTELKVCDKTEMPLKLSKKTFQLTTDAGFWLTCFPRENPTITVS